MPTIRVTCPACHSTLELDAQHAGQEVECGSCLQLFVAKPPAPPAKPAGIRGVAARPGTRRPPARKPAPRRDDEDDDYEHDHYEDDYPETRRSSGTGTAALVLGILSVVAFCCPLVSGLFAVLAIIFGAVGRSNPMDRGSATAGLVLGVVGLVCTGGFLLMLNERWVPPFLR